MCSDKQIKKTPSTDAEDLAGLGLLCAQSNDMEKAIEYWQQAQALSPTDSRLFNNLGNAYKKTGQVDAAITHYLKAITLNPMYAQAHNNLAALYASQNRYKDALLHYKHAVHAAPDFTAAHFNLGLLLLQNQEVAAAKVQFLNVLNLNPDRTEAHFYLGVIALENNELTEAKQAFLKVLHHNEEHIQALTNLGVILIKQEEHQQAIDCFSKALALDNEHTEARHNLAALFMHHDRFENALIHYDVLLKKDPDHIEWLYNCGVAEMALGQLNKACQHFETLLRHDSNHCPSLKNMAAISRKRDDNTQARHYLDRALAINPDDEISQHMLCAMNGQTPTKTSPEYAQNLFNHYAMHYDKHMNDQLQYSIPHDIGRLLHQLPITTFNHTLDLGCGTGLTGIVLREQSKQLTGVDIAEKMLAQAKEKGIYDKLIQAELIHFLNTNKEHYDLVVAADVFPYFGDLNTLFQSLKTHLSPNAYFIFSTEISTTLPWTLQKTARYSHHPDYIKTLLTNNHLELTQQTITPARLDHQVPIEVAIYTVHVS